MTTGRINQVASIRRTPRSFPKPPLSGVRGCGTVAPRRSCERLMFSSSCSLPGGRAGGGFSCGVLALPPRREEQQGRSRFPRFPFEWSLLSLLSLPRRGPPLPSRKRVFVGGALRRRFMVRDGQKPATLLPTGAAVGRISCPRIA